ncbi:hypothetical protein GCM10029964_098230 [Kibdelosporangium lantanae]
MQGFRWSAAAATGFCVTTLFKTQIQSCEIAAVNTCPAPRVIDSGGCRNHPPGNWKAMNLVLGLAGLAMAVAGLWMAWRAKRKAAEWVGFTVQMAGWQVCAGFLVKPYVPAAVWAGVLLGGIVLGILAVAAVAWWGRRKRTDSTSQDDVRRS